MMDIETLRALLNLMRLTTLNLSRRNTDSNIELSIDEFAKPTYRVRKAEDSYCVIDEFNAIALDEVSELEAEICAFAWNVNPELQWIDLLPVIEVLEKTMENER